MRPAEQPGDEKAPRRIVLLVTTEHGEIETVLKEYSSAEASGSRLHADLKQLAGEHAGRWVAAEWLGPKGWARFLWCQR